MPSSVQLEQVLSCIQSNEQHLHPSVISTRSLVLPTWILAEERSSSSSCHLRSLQALSNDATSGAMEQRSHSALSHDDWFSGGTGVTSVQQTLEIQYPPISPQSSPIPVSPERGRPQARKLEELAAFSDDDDVSPSAAWRM